MFTFLQIYICPKGHEQSGTGHDQDWSAPDQCHPAYCMQCLAEWLTTTFPTKPKNGLKP